MKSLGKPLYISHKPSGFTLIELLVVISIIAILASLIIAGVNSARQSMTRAQVKSEITGLEAALEDFAREYGGAYPPSSVTLYESQTAGWDTDNRSKNEIKSIWNSFDFKDRDLNGDGDMTDQFVLNGAECLVFFLGGIFTKDSDNSPVPNGFAKNVADPFQLPSVSPNRVGPFFDFKKSRLVLNTNDKVHYVDPIPGQRSPYWYISSYKGRGYRYKYHTTSVDAGMSVADAGHELPSNTGSLAGLNYADTTNKVDLGTGITVPDHAMLMPYLQSGLHPYVKDDGTNNAKSSHQPWKPSGFQIISPGPDGKYGSGGVYKEGDSSKISESDRDNITNFTTGNLN